MRQSVASVALIHREEGSQPALLLQWNAKWKALSFIGGHKEPDESFRECAVRETAEELGLRPDSDFIVGDQPLSHLEYTAWSESAKADTVYVMEVFRVKLAAGAAAVTANPANRWVTEADVQEGHCGDGARVSPSVAKVLSLLPAIEAWPRPLSP